MHIHICTFTYIFDLTSSLLHCITYLIRTLFSRLINSLMYFLNFFTTKIMILFPAAQIQSNFSFLVTYESFNSVCARENAAPS